MDSRSKAITREQTLRMRSTLTGPPPHTVYLHPRGHIHAGYQVPATQELLISVSHHHRRLILYIYGLT